MATNPCSDVFTCVCSTVFWCNGYTFIFLDKNWFMLRYILIIFNVEQQYNSQIFHVVVVNNRRRFIVCVFAMSGWVFVWMHVCIFSRRVNSRGPPSLFFGPYCLYFLSHSVSSASGQQPGVENTCSQQRHATLETAFQIETLLSLKCFCLQSADITRYRHKQSCVCINKKALHKIMNLPLYLLQLTD